MNNKLTNRFEKNIREYAVKSYLFRLEVAETYVADQTAHTSLIIAPTNLKKGIQVSVQSHFLTIPEDLRVC